MNYNNYNNNNNNKNLSILISKEIEAKLLDVNPNFSLEQRSTLLKLLKKWTRKKLLKRGVSIQQVKQQLNQIIGEVLEKFNQEQEERRKEEEDIISKDGGDNSFLGEEQNIEDGQFYHEERERLWSELREEILELMTNILGESVGENLLLPFYEWEHVKHATLSYLQMKERQYRRLPRQAIERVLDEILPSAESGRSFVRFLIHELQRLKRTPPPYYSGIKQQGKEGEHDDEINTSEDDNKSLLRDRAIRIIAGTITELAQQKFIPIPRIKYLEDITDRNNNQIVDSNNPKIISPVQNLHETNTGSIPSKTTPIKSSASIVSADDQMGTEYVNWINYFKNRKLEKKSEKIEFIISFCRRVYENYCHGLQKEPSSEYYFEKLVTIDGAYNADIYEAPRYSRFGTSLQSQHLTRNSPTGYNMRRNHYSNSFGRRSFGATGSTYNSASQGIGELQIGLPFYRDPKKRMQQLKERHQTLLQRFHLLNAVENAFNTLPSNELKRQISLSVAFFLHEQQQKMNLQNEVKEFCKEQETGSDKGREIVPVEKIKQYYHEVFARESTKLLKKQHIQSYNPPPQKKPSMYDERDRKQIKKLIQDFEQLTTEELQAALDSTFIGEGGKKFQEIVWAHMTQRYQHRGGKPPRETISEDHPVQVRANKVLRHLSKITEYICLRGPKERAMKRALFEEVCLERLVFCHEKLRMKAESQEVKGAAELLQSVQALEVLSRFIPLLDDTLRYELSCAKAAAEKNPEEAQDSLDAKKIEESKYLRALKKMFIKRKSKEQKNVDDAVQGVDALLTGMDEREQSEFLAMLVEYEHEQNQHLKYHLNYSRLNPKSNKMI